jgi:hypothetical protein
MFEYKLDAPPVAVTVSTPAARAAPGANTSAVNARASAI